MNMKTRMDVMYLFSYKVRIISLGNPTQYTDNTYRTVVDVLQGHDGSIIKAYGDYRDSPILELEKRIYNNIKISS